MNTLPVVAPLKRSRGPREDAVSYPIVCPVVDGGLSVLVPAALSPNGRSSTVSLSDYFSPRVREVIEMSFGAAHAPTPERVDWPQGTRFFTRNSPNGRRVVICFPTGQEIQTAFVFRPSADVPCAIDKMRRNGVSLCWQVRIEQESSRRLPSVVLHLSSLVLQGAWWGPRSLRPVEDWLYTQIPLPRVTRLCALPFPLERYVSLSAAATARLGFMIPPYKTGFRREVQAWCDALATACLGRTFEDM